MNWYLLSYSIHFQRDIVCNFIWSVVRSPTTSSRFRLPKNLHWCKYSYKSVLLKHSWEVKILSFLLVALESPQDWKRPVKLFKFSHSLSVETCLSTKPNIHNTIMISSPSYSRKKNLLNSNIMNSNPYHQITWPWNDKVKKVAVIMVKIMVRESGCAASGVLGANPSHLLGNCLVSIRWCILSLQGQCQHYRPPSLS